MTVQQSLLTVIAQQPEDDTVRRGYADWLQENDQHDRAEFIRVQCELSRSYPGWRDEPAPGSLAAGGPYHNLKIRERELLDRHRVDWSRLPCPGCGGRGEMVFAEMPRVRSIIEIIEGNVPDISLPRTRRGPCPTCSGTGDLFRRVVHEDGRDRILTRTVTFSRGFPESVSCTLAEVGRMEAHQLGDTVRHVWVPSEWAKAAVKASPVVKFAVAGVELYRSPDGSWTFPQTSLPYSLLKMVEGNHRSETAAAEVLAVRLGGLVRAEVYGKAVPT